MSKAVEAAMKAANVTYEVKGPSEDKGVPDKPVAEVKESDFAVKEKLVAYTPDRFLKEEKEDIKEDLAFIGGLVGDLESSCREADPINAMVVMKRITEFLTELGKTFVPYANNQYVTGEFGGTDAKIAKYTPKRKWKYSRGLTEQMTLLDAKRKAEEKSGVAVDESPPVDVVKSKIFTISLKK